MCSECGSRCEQDVLVGSVLLQAKLPLFAEDQETEEGLGSLPARRALTQRFQADGGVPVPLDQGDRRLAGASRGRCAPS